jgi:(S)-ureidoglycine aminohydrolase
MTDAWRADRGRRGRGYTILTPANRYASRLPNLRDALVFKLATPRLAPARFGQYLLAFEPGGGTTAPFAADLEDFLYVLRGEIVLDDGADMPSGSWCYLPPGIGFGARAVGDAPAELLWVKRPYEAWPGLDAPERDFGHRDDEPWQDTGVPGFRRRELLDPLDARHDFNMSLLAFDPGTGLDTVEIHDEEHGLYMTAGSGTYHLDGQDYAVRQDDFIYMAPYCPQSFLAADEPSEYLLYKDVFRDGF